MAPCVKHLTGALPPSTVQSAGTFWEQVRHSLTSRLHISYFSIYWRFLQSSSFPFTLFFFFFNLFCLTGGGCLSVARAWMGGGSAKSPCLQPPKRARAWSTLLGQFSRTRNKTLESTEETPHCALRSWGLVHRLVVKRGGPPRIVFAAKTQDARASQGWRGIETHVALKANRRTVSWKSPFRLCLTLGESRGMATVYLQGAEGGRSTARPPAKPGPEMKQQKTLLWGKCWSADLQTGNAKPRPRSTCPPILCRGKEGCLRSATQTQPYTDWGAKFARWIFVLAIKVPPSFALSTSVFFWL